jgi:hypothetical protein
LRAVRAGWLLTLGYELAKMPETADDLRASAPRQAAQYLIESAVAYYMMAPSAGRANCDEAESATGA